MTEVKLNNKFTLNDKYTLLEGRIILSGIQALVRLLLDQNRADLIKGINTGTLVSGYRGSPVGMLDINLVRNKKLLDQHNINFIPGVNEDLGATLIYGSQMAGMVSNVKYDGVLGMWYGKAPELQDKWEAAFFEALKNFKFVPGGRIMHGAGREDITTTTVLVCHSFLYYTIIN